jgi:hypothetical protein
MSENQATSAKDELIVEFARDDRSTTRRNQFNRRDDSNPFPGVHQADLRFRGDVDLHGGAAARIDQPHALEHFPKVRPYPPYRGYCQRVSLQRIEASWDRRSCQ